MRIAIVGTGVAGLTCAPLLHGIHDVTVFEAQDRPGGHAHTVTVDLPDGATVARLLDHLRAAGLIGSGMIGDPDPYTATVNALNLFRVDDVVISTLPGERSGWLRSNLVERVRGATGATVEHIVVDPSAEHSAAPAA